LKLTFHSFKKTFFLFIPHIIKNPSSIRRGFIALALILADIATSSLVPYFSKQVVDSLSLSIAAGVSISLFFLGLFWTIEKTTSHLQEIIFFPVINTAIRNITFDVVQHIHKIPLASYQKLSIPEVINCMRRISFSARSFIKVLFLLIIPTFFKLCIATAITIKLGLFGFGLAFSLILALFVLYKGTAWYVGTREAAWRTTDIVTTRMNDSLLNTKTARFFNNFEMNEVGTLLTTEAHLWYKTNTRLHTIHILIGLLLGLTITLILYFAIKGIQQQTLTIGDFVMLKGQLIAAFLPLKSLSVEFRQLAESLIDIKKITQIFEIEPQKKLEFSMTPLSTTEAIVFKKVSFSHATDATLFNELSLSIKTGEKILIIGKTGCGKSTLLTLMNALYSIQKGSIWIYGHEISYLSHEALSRLVCLIPQDLHLFNQSIRYNLTYGLASVSESELQKIIHSIGLTEIIELMPNGLETIVGEMGSRLSGGEQQLVALARALLLKPKILLLDETTHSLNLDKEKKVLQEIFKAIPTVIIVSHKNLTLPEINRVLVLEKGTLEEKVLFPLPSNVIV